MTDRPNTRVLAAINSVQRAVSDVGIAKERRNTDQGFNYRGIDDVYNVVGPILANAGLFILPVGMERTVSPFKSSKGTEGQHAVVQGHYRWQHVEGEHLDIEAYGEATDYQHRAVAKAMSTAYKNMLFSVLCIPLDGVDADDSVGDSSPTRDPMAALRAFMTTHQLSERDVCAFAEVASLDLIDNPGAVLAQIAERVTTLSKSVTKGVAASDRCMVPPRVVSAYVQQVLDAPTAWEGMQVWRGIGDQAVQVLVWSQIGSRERSALKAAKAPDNGMSETYRAAYQRISEAADEDQLNFALDDIMENYALTPTELADITVYAQSREFPGA